LLLAGVTVLLFWGARPRLREAGPARQDARRRLAEMGRWSYAEIVMACTFLGMLALWCTARWHGLPTGLVALMGVAVLVVSGANLVRFATTALLSLFRLGRPLAETGDVRLQLGRVERFGLRVHREVDGRQHRPLEV